jgi:hypothetical protein
VPLYIDGIERLSKSAFVSTGGPNVEKYLAKSAPYKRIDKPVMRIIARCQIILYRFMFLFALYHDYTIKRTHLYHVYPQGHKIKESYEKR